MVESIAAHTRHPTICAGKGCTDPPSVAIDRERAPITAYCGGCAERVLAHDASAREYPLDDLTPPDLATTFTPVEESACGVAYELSPPADDPELCETWILGRNTHTEAHRQETIIDLDETT